MVPIGSRRAAARVRRAVRTGVQSNPYYRRAFVDSLEGRFVLTTDLSSVLITAIKNNFNSIFNTVDAVHDRVFNNVLARSLPLIGTALNVLDGPADLLNRVSDDIRDKIGELAPLTEFDSDA